MHKVSTTISVMLVISLKCTYKWVANIKMKLMEIDCALVSSGLGQGPVTDSC